MPDSPRPRPLRDFFADVPDPRVVGRSQHELVDVILIVIVATIGGADDFVSIARFAKAKEAWLRDRLGLRLPYGIPSHDTLLRVFASLSPSVFHERFQEWVAVASVQLKVKQIPIDGKTMRGSGTATQRMRHVVSAWASETGLTLAQLATDEQSNEITAIPDLLDLLDISGAFVSIDALGCQKEIAAKIIDGGGDYLLSVKGNQPHLHEDIECLAMAAMENDYQHLSQQYQETHAHGRDEWRFCFVLNELASLRTRDEWPELQSVIVVVRHRVVNGQASDETAYYISSRKGSAKTFQAAVRQHWSIENQCHWVLDVAFGEDDHRLASGHSPANLALVRKMALAMLKKTPAKMGIKNKRLAAGWDNDFLELVLRDFLED